jgi:hypothetical protein
MNIYPQGHLGKVWVCHGKIDQRSNIMASELILEKLLLKLLYRVQSAFINEQTILKVHLCNFNMFFLVNDSKISLSFKAFHLPMEFLWKVDRVYPDTPQQ